AAPGGAPPGGGDAAASGPGALAWALLGLTLAAAGLLATRLATLRRPAAG
ncbi:MAG: hypothetical protein QOD86_3090, partial [Miltoncostaeaceae bacterium]|nr:hypothetical protein [Miltoncostaeaceae bacterium]